MLDPWIIEEIRRREEQQKQRERQPAVIELPLHAPQKRDEERPGRGDEKDVPRGVAIIEL
jgi:hypothetical protein